MNIVAILVSLFLFFSEGGRFPILSERHEIALGDLWMGQAIEEMGGEGAEPLVSEVGLELARLSSRPNLPYRFAVVESDEVNAWAFPGGRILIARGMLDIMDGDNELAFILGHEIGHVVGRHLEGRHMQAFGAVAVSFFTGSPLVGHLLCLWQSRCQEREADRIAVELVQAAGYDLPTALYWFERLEGRGKSFDLLSTHPRGDRRLEPILRAQMSG